MTVPAIALTKVKAAEALCMSVDSFERHVQSDLRVIRRGRLRLYPTSELEHWARANAKPVLPTTAARATGSSS